MKRLMLVSVGLTALTVGIVLAWYSMRQDREFQRLIAAGDAALVQDETYGAIEAFSGALALKQDSMLAYLKRGDAYRRRGELNAALRDLRQAASLDPSAPRPIELLGDVNAALNRHDQAAEHYRAFTQLDDRSPKVLYKLGLALVRNGQTAEALEPLKQALALDGRIAEVHYLLATCLREGGDERGALAALTQAIDVNPTFVAPREELALLHERAGRWRGALEQLEALSALEPGQPRRMVDVGLAYARWGRVDEAIIALGRAAERHPDQTEVYTAIGRVWLQTAEARDDQVALGKAMEALARTAAATDASSETLALYGRATLLSGNVVAAERILTLAAAKSPVDPHALRYLADAADRLGHVSIARQALLRYVALVGERAIEPALADQLEGLAPQRGTL